MSIQDDPHSNVTQVLRKIEGQLNFFCEERNFLNVKFDRDPVWAATHLNPHDKSIVSITVFEHSLQLAKKAQRQKE